MSVDLTQKEACIVGYLKNHGGQAYMIEIRDEVAMQFDHEEDFERTLADLESRGILVQEDTTEIRLTKGRTSCLSSWIKNIKNFIKIS